MSKSIRVIETGIDISKIVAELEAHPEDWGSQKKYGNGHLNPETCMVSAEVLQLIMPATIPGVPQGEVMKFGYMMIYVSDAFASVTFFEQASV